MRYHPRAEHLFSLKYFSVFRPHSWQSTAPAWREKKRRLEKNFNYRSLVDVSNKTLLQHLDTFTTITAWTLPPFKLHNVIENKISSFKSETDKPVSTHNDNDWQDYNYENNDNHNNNDNDNDNDVRLAVTPVWPGQVWRRAQSTSTLRTIVTPLSIMVVTSLSGPC